LECNHHLGQLSLAYLQVAKSSTSFGWGKGGKITAAGWQVTLCDPIWHVISRSGVVISTTNCYICVYFSLLYFTVLDGRRKHSIHCKRSGGGTRPTLSIATGVTKPDPTSEVHRAFDKDLQVCFQTKKHDLYMCTTESLSRCVSVIYTTTGDIPESLHQNLGSSFHRQPSHTLHSHYNSACYSHITFADLIITLCDESRTAWF